MWQLWAGLDRVASWPIGAVMGGPHMHSAALKPGCTGSFRPDRRHMHLWLAQMRAVRTAMCMWASCEARRAPF